MRAKFKVVHTFNDGKNVTLHPITEVPAVTIYDGNNRRDVVITPEIPPPPENAAFFAATPGGEIRLLMIAPDSATEFSIGREFFIDFTPAA